MRRLALLFVVFIVLPTTARGQGESAAKDQELIYEGWRQYSVHCARCHGQDVLGNPVAANLLVTTAPGGSTAEREAFHQVVLKGRPERGMPPFEGVLTPEQVQGIYLYVKGRAEKKIPPGRPEAPAG